MGRDEISIALAAALITLLRMQLSAGCTGSRPCRSNRQHTHLVAQHRRRQADTAGTLAGGVDSTRRHLGNVLQQLRLGNAWRREGECPNVWSRHVFADSSQMQRVKQGVELANDTLAVERASHEKGTRLTLVLLVCQALPHRRSQAYYAPGSPMRQMWMSPRSFMPSGNERVTPPTICSRSACSHIEGWRAQCEEGMLGSSTAPTICRGSGLAQRTLAVC